QVFLLHVVVVRADDGFLALEVVVGGAERETGLCRDVTNRGFLEAAFTEEGEGGLEDLAAGFFAGGALGDGPIGGSFEHVQRLRGPLDVVKTIFERVQNRHLWILSRAPPMAPVLSANLVVLAGIARWVLA